MLTRPCRRCGQEFQPSRDYYHSCWACWRVENLNTQADAAAEVRRENEQLRRDIERLRAQLNAPHSGLDSKTIRQLVQLVHPDKHHGSQLATEVTQKLLQMKAGAR